jgi:phage-related protein
VEIFKVFGSVFLNGSKETKEDLDDIDKKGEKTGNTLGQMGKKIGKGAKIAGGAMLAAGGVISGFAAKGAEATDRVDKMSQKLGLSRKGFQEWEFIASQSGFAIEDLAGDMAALANKLDEAKAGMGESAELFDELGIDASQLANQEEAFEAIVEGLQGMEDQNRKAAIANKLLGGAAREMMPLLNGQAGSIDDLKKKAGELGLVMGDDVIDAGVGLTDTIDQLTRTMSAGLMPILAGIMPMVGDLANMILENAPMIMSMLAPLFDLIMPFFANMTEYMIPILLVLLEMLIQNILPVLINLFNSFATDILPILMEVLNVFITDVLPVLMELFNEIIVAIMPLLLELFGQLAEDLLPILVQIIKQVVVGLKPLIKLFIELLNKVLPPLIKVATFLADVFGDVLSGAIQDLEPVISNIIGIFENLINFVKNVFAGDWSAAWQNIINIFENTFGGIGNLAKVPINGVIRLMNGFIRGINKIKIPDWVPELGGKGINIPSIPLLAEGGRILQAGTAIVGEAGPEMINLPQGAQVTPLTDGNRSSALGKGGVNVIIQKQYVNDGKDFVKKTDRELRNKQLRGAFNGA